MNIDITAWLDGTETTEDQRDRIERAVQTIEARYPAPDDGQLADVAEEREAALSAAAQIILGDSRLEELTSAYASAQRRAMLAHAAQTGALIAEAQEVSKMDLHRRTGLSRPTIDKAVG